MYREEQHKKKQEEYLRKKDEEHRIEKTKSKEGGHNVSQDEKTHSQTKLEVADIMRQIAEAKSKKPQSKALTWIYDGF